FPSGERPRGRELIHQERYVGTLQPDVVGQLLWLELHHKSVWPDRQVGRDFAVAADRLSVNPRLRTAHAIQSECNVSRFGDVKSCGGEKHFAPSLQTQFGSQITARQVTGKCRVNRQPILAFKIAVKDLFVTGPGCGCITSPNARDSAPRRVEWPR